jgi:uncharacterized membrane protein YeaQ/YmgE (transglycosylase-associated protein family)
MEEAMNILWIIVIGFLAGLVARFLAPGPNNPQGFILTTILGIVGAFLATFIGQMIGWYRPRSGRRSYRGRGGCGGGPVHLAPTGGAGGYPGSRLAPVVVARPRDVWWSMIPRVKPEDVSFRMPPGIKSGADFSRITL